MFMAVIGASSVCDEAAARAPLADVRLGLAFAGDRHPYGPARFLPASPHDMTDTPNAPSRSPAS